ncbi:Cellulose synthase-like protein B3 [Nymphaea thermarum]|nr:Cellulose synthase-like protein B3 [Nymphaea thermarum]
MTSAPFMLNLDCDMFVNNPKVLYQALCLLLGFESEVQSGFVQFPQIFHGALKDDPYGNQLKVLIKWWSTLSRRLESGVGIACDCSKVHLHFNGVFEGLKLQLRQCMVYLSVLLWAARSVPELCYAILPALCIFTNTSIFPKITDPEFKLPAAVFIIFNIYTLVEYLLCGLSLREWWNNQRMAKIVSSTAWLFGLLAVLLKVFGISETVFELTRKDDLEGASPEAGKFIFDSSAIYVPATTLLFVNMTALALGLAKMVMEMEAAAHVGELVCCAWVVMSFLPFVKGLFRRGQYGIPWPTVCKSGTATLILRKGTRERETMSGSGGLPLQERVEHPNTVERVFLSILSVLILCLLLYRLAVLPELPGGAAFGVWLAAFLWECWFAFMWVLSLNYKWHFVENRTFPDRLFQRLDRPLIYRNTHTHTHTENHESSCNYEISYSKSSGICRFKSSQEFPAMDVFVTTADPVMEPPIITVNTVLSILAVDYPASKIACYVSDDGCSPITFFSLLEASKFAHSWVPFCKKYGVEYRAPFKYFSLSQTYHNPSSTFHQDWKEMKKAYEELAKKILEAAHKSIPDEFSGEEFSDFAQVEKRNHPAIVKIINEHKGREDDQVPHLIYVSREKRPSHAHHFKAGAMNVLVLDKAHVSLNPDGSAASNPFTRVSGVMTSAPFMLNLDCDMFVNNPKALYQALCLLLGFESEVQSGFVQFPQMFHGALKDDPYGNQLKVLIKHLMPGSNACQGPMYGGTCCFHRRKVIYGQQPSERPQAKNGPHNYQLANEALAAIFGRNQPLIESALRATSEGRALVDPSPSETLSSSLEAAIAVSACDYEDNTLWGKQITDPEFKLPAAVFIIFNIYILVEYLLCGLSVREWWNNQRMARIVSSTAWLFGLLAVLLKVFGISETVFELTRKDDLEGAPAEAGKFIFDSSAIYVPATTLLFVNMTALVLGLANMVMEVETAAYVGELVCCAWVVMSFLPFVKGLFRRGQCGIPWPTVCKSGTASLIFICLCRRFSN